MLKKRLGFWAPAEGEVPVSVENCGWSVWAQPFYHSGTQKGDSLRTEIDADYTGGSAGVVKRAGNYAFGLGLHAGKGDLDGSRYDANVEGLGFVAGITRRFRAGEVFSPEIALTGGYSHYSIEQTRKSRGDVSPEGAGVYESEPSVTMWNAAVSAGNDFTVGGGFSLRPEFGFDYLSAKMKHYRESGGYLALNVEPERYDSFRSSAGIVANWRPLDTLRLSVSGHWHHEFADKNVALRSRSGA